MVLDRLAKAVRGIADVLQFQGRMLMVAAMIGAAPVYAQTPPLEPTTPPDITLSCQPSVRDYPLGPPFSVQVWPSEHVLAWIRGERILLPAEIGPTQITFSRTSKAGEKTTVTIGRLTGAFSMVTSNRTGSRDELDGTCTPAKPKF